MSPLQPRDPHEPHRASTQLELLFDLVSVIAISAITAAFHHAASEGHGLAFLPNYVFLFTAIWWAWMNFTWFASAFDNDDMLYRWLTMIIMCGALIFAGGVGAIFQNLSFQWGLIGWIIMRIGMIGLWLRAAESGPTYRKTALRYAAGIAVAQAGWTALNLLTLPGSATFLWGGVLVFLLEFSVPAYAERAGATPWHRHHIIERYGLLTIIVLGEGLLSVAHGYGLLFEGNAEADAAIIATSGLIITFSLWAIYFVEPEHLRTKGSLDAFIWGYGHLPFFMGAALIGGGIGVELDVADHRAVTDYETAAWYLGGPLALCLIVLWLVRDCKCDLGARRWALPIMAGMMILGSLLAIPAWGFALLMLATALWRVPLN